MMGWSRLIYHDSDAPLMQWTDTQTNLVVFHDARIDQAGGLGVSLTALIHPDCIAQLMGWLRRIAPHVT